MITAPKRISPAAPATEACLFIAILLLCLEVLLQIFCSSSVNLLENTKLASTRTEVQMLLLLELNYGM